MNNKENLRKWALHNQEMINNVGTKTQKEILSEALKIQSQGTSPSMIPTPPTPQFVPPQTISNNTQIKPKSTSPSPLSSSKTIVTGDSVATGIGYGGAKGNENSEAAWGRSSADQLAFMKRKGADYYRGANVILSSGVLNSGDIKSVEAQLKFLKQSGARNVRLAGAPLAGPYSKYNQQLEALAKKYGFQFIGGYDSSDGVHPRSYTNYR